MPRLRYPFTIKMDLFLYKDYMEKIYLLSSSALCLVGMSSKQKTKQQIKGISVQVAQGSLKKISLWHGLASMITFRP